MNATLHESTNLDLLTDDIRARFHDGTLPLVGDDGPISWKSEDHEEGYGSSDPSYEILVKSRYLTITVRRIEPDGAEDEDRYEEWQILGRAI